jgi:hypothetical protein
VENMEYKMWSIKQIIWCMSLFSGALLFGANAIANQTPTERFVLLDFEDPVLHDLSWFQSQKKGAIGTYVQSKNEPGIRTLSLAMGEGRGGGNALLVESPNKTVGFPKFWIFKSIQR